MSEELLAYYNRELSFIRRSLNEFADNHREHADRLRIRRDEVEDPHVSRLIEAFAYLTARIRRKLDDEFPEISDSLLQVLYPHYLAPIPSMAIVQFELDQSQGELSTGYRISAREELEGAGDGSKTCRFRTSYDTTLWPIVVTKAEFMRRPFAAPPSSQAADAQAALRIQLRCTSENMSFDQFEMTQLRFFLQGQDHHVFPLYELLMNDVLHVAIGHDHRKAPRQSLPPQCLRPVGFGKDDLLLPSDARSSRGYHLLTDFFAFPRKYLFLDVSEMDPKTWEQDSTLEIYVYFGRGHEDLERNVSADTFRLGCAPAVNLFEKRAEPFKLTHQQSSHRIVPDARRKDSTEVYSIDSVTAVSPDGSKHEFSPFYSMNHQSQAPYWFAVRNESGSAIGPKSTGTDVDLSLVNLDKSSALAPGWTVSVETTCLNRDLPHEANIREFRSLSGGPLQRAECLYGPTRTLRPSRGAGGMWRLISHLSLNHRSITHLREDDELGENTAAALQEILRLYDFGDTTLAKRQIASVESVRSKRIVGRAGGIAGGFCRGVQIEVRFDESAVAEESVFLLAAVLNQFFGLYSSINSFTTLVAESAQRDGIIKKWDPRAGQRTIV